MYLTIVFGLRDIWGDQQFNLVDVLIVLFLSVHNKQRESYNDAKLNID